MNTEERTRPRVSDRNPTSFDTVRPRLCGIAYRVIGSAGEADDVVQETWIRCRLADRSEVRDPAAFLATTTTRLAINVIQSARARRETSIASPRPEAADKQADPMRDVVQREALALAVGVLLARLSPTERAAYVLREAFDYPHREIAAVLSLTEVNARQLVARARRRLCNGNARAVSVPTQERLCDTVALAARTGAARTARAAACRRHRGGCERCRRAGPGRLVAKRSRSGGRMTQAAPIRPLRSATGLRFRGGCHTSPLCPVLAVAPLVPGRPGDRDGRSARAGRHPTKSRRTSKWTSRC